MFLKEKLRGLVDVLKLPLADCIPTIPPPPSASMSRAKSLRTASMVSLSFSPRNTSDNQKARVNWSYNNKQHSFTHLYINWLQVIVEEISYSFACVMSYHWIQSKAAILTYPECSLFRAGWRSVGWSGSLASRKNTEFLNQTKYRYCSLRRDKKKVWEAFKKRGKEQVHNTRETCDR